MEEPTEISQSLMNRVYYAARDGMAIALFALLSDNESMHVDELLNQVRIFIILFFFFSFQSIIRYFFFEPEIRQPEDTVAHG